MDDDPYTTTETSRAEAFGVEEQVLAFNEAQIIFAKRALDALDQPQNQKSTEYDDTLNRDWTFIELENVSPRPVDFNNKSWQISLGPNPDPATPPLPGFVINPKNLTLQGNWKRRFGNEFHSDHRHSRRWRQQRHAAQRQPKPG